MFYRKDAVLMAVAGILATAGFAHADNNAVKAPALTLDPVASDTATMATPPSGPLMMGLDKIGVGDPLQKLGLNIYGWVEGGYTYDNRHHRTLAPILPGPFNHEFGGVATSFTGPIGGGDRNHFMLNQVDIRFERLVANDKWDVGGMVEFQYGTDAAGIHSNGLALGNDSYQGKGGTDFFRTGELGDDRFNPQYQVDPTQAYIDVNVPVGNGLVIRTGKFVTLMGYETLDPRGNPFYSHSYLFSALPFTQTGILGMYKINDQWEVKGGISRGWDQSLEDNNGAIDALGQVIFTPNKQWQAVLSWTEGPENDRDTSHYRTAVDAILTWQATAQLKLGLEGLYIYDGGRNADGIRAEGSSDRSHGYGDQWGGALYGQYVINDYATFNLRLEKFHDDAFNLLDTTSLNGEGEPLGGGLFGGNTVNFYSVTAGVTIHPFPHDPIGRSLMIRPEVRYTYSDGPHPFLEGDSISSGHAFKDQLLFAADVVWGF